MTRTLLALFLGTLGACFLTQASLRAAEPKLANQPYVVIVGIAEYADKQIKPRPRAEEDAKALYDLFTDKKYFGADADHVKLLLGSDEKDAKRSFQKATHANIVKALHWLATNAKTDDPAIFVFIGQGCSLGELGDRTCYFASDSTLKDRAKDSLASTEIAQELDKLKSHRFCAFLDVNFKGYTAGKDPIPEARLDSGAYKEYLAPQEGEDQGAASGRALFLATNGLSQSLDLEKQGIFTQVLLDGLKGAADKEGYEPDGVVTVDELAEYLEKELPELARKNGKTKAEKEQLAFFLGSRGSHFELTENPAVMPKVKERLEKLAQLHSDKKINDKQAEEGKRLLSRMPKLENQRSMRKAYQQLVDGTLAADKFEEKRDSILAETKLKPSEAAEFAAKVMKCVQLVRDDHVKSTNSGELVNWAIRGLYRYVDEKIPQEIADKLANVKDMKDADLTKLLTDARMALGKREDLDKHKDVDVTLPRMLSHLDPYTTFIDAETKKRMEADMRGRFPGIGIQIRKDGASDMLQVVTPIRGSPAHKAGVLAGDIITKVTRLVDDKGKPLDKPEEITTKGMPLPEAVKKITGLPGTKVKITVDREGSDKPLDFEITRGWVQVETALGIKRQSDGSWDYYVDPESKIGYVRLTQFSEKTAKDLEAALNEMKKKGINGFVLDLRFNPGGLLNSAVDISDLFIDDGVIVTIRPRVEDSKVISGKHDGSLLDFPMVCLVNGGSASGSEIVSACLQDHHRAIIIGERSYGKGSVQNIQPFEGGDLKMTTASFWRPSGKNLNKSSTGGKDDEDWGVLPDKGFEVKLSRKERDDLAEHQHNLEVIPRADRPEKEVKPEFKDKQLDTALDYLRNQIKLAGRVPAKKAG